jgi:hypothetical protein
MQELIKDLLLHSDRLGLLNFGGNALLVEFRLLLLVLLKLRQSHVDIVFFVVFSLAILYLLSSLRLLCVGWLVILDLTFII